MGPLLMCREAALGNDLGPSKEGPDEAGPHRVIVCQRVVITISLFFFTETGFKSPFNLALTMEIKEKITLKNNFKKYKVLNKTFKLNFLLCVLGGSSIWKPHAWSFFCWYLPLWGGEVRVTCDEPEQQGGT